MNDLYNNNAYERKQTQSCMLDNLQSRHRGIALVFFSCDTLF